MDAVYLLPGADFRAYTKVMLEVAEPGPDVLRVRTAVGSTAESFGKMNTDHLLPAGGAGLRFKASEEYGVNARIDYAWGKDSQASLLLGGQAVLRPVRSEREKTPVRRGEAGAKVKGDEKRQSGPPRTAKPQTFKLVSQVRDIRCIPEAPRRRCPRRGPCLAEGPIPPVAGGIGLTRACARGPATFGGALRPGKALAHARESSAIRRKP